MRCTLIGSTTTPTTPNPYGSAHNCSITLRGRILQGPRLVQHTNSSHGIIYLDSSRKKEYESSRSLLALESLVAGIDSTTQQLEIIGLELYVYASSVLGSSHFIARNLSVIMLLQRRADEAHFTRLGTLEQGDPKWFELEGQERTVTIK